MSNLETEFRWMMAEIEAEFDRAARAPTLRESAQRSEGAVAALRRTLRWARMLNIGDNTWLAPTPLSPFGVGRSA